MISKPSRLGYTLDLFESAVDASMIWGGRVYVTLALFLIGSVTFVYFKAVLPQVRRARVHIGYSKGV